MFASEVVDKSTVLGARDDDPADLSVPEMASYVEVISARTVFLADAVRLAATFSAVGGALRNYRPRRKRLRA
jgi:hypothetical protein